MPGGLQVCEEFLQASPSTTAIVVDPPFGGLAEVLAMTLKKLWEVAGTGAELRGDMLATVSYVVWL